MTVAPLRITHISDPGCPFAYSAMPFLTALRWRYGDQIEWRHVMIGLTEDRTQYEERGYTPLLMARGQRRFARFGMPFAREPKPRMAATARACRLVVATRLHRPELEWEMFRALQFTQFTTPFPLDSDEALRAALARVPQLDADTLMGMLDSDAVTAAYEADRAEARTAEGGPTEFQGKAANTDGKVRFTAPSLIIETTDGRRLEAGGFQPLEVYDVLIANLDPTLVRRAAAPDPGAVVEAFPYALATREIATCMIDGTDAVDDARAEDELLELVTSGEVQTEHVGDSALWRAAGTRFSRAAERRDAAAAA
jgi:2-hydroxychromene-2-carboxylate isomerase